MTLESQYEDFKKENPQSVYSFEEWKQNVLVPMLDKAFTDLGPKLEEALEKHFDETLTQPKAEETNETSLLEELIQILKPGDQLVPEAFHKKNLSDFQKTLIEDAVIKYMKVKNVVWVDFPAFLDENENALVVKTMRLDYTTNHQKAPDKTCYLYNVTFTPKMYSEVEISKPVKDGCVISPTMYDYTTFMPYKSITLQWSPEHMQDSYVVGEPVVDEKQMIRDMLEKVLANPEEYMPAGKIYALIRLAFSK